MPLPSGRRALSALVCLVGASCQAFFGADDYVSGEGTGGIGTTGHHGGASTTGAAGTEAGTGGIVNDCLCADDVASPWTSAYFLYTTTPEEAFTCPELMVESLYKEGPPQGTYECTACGCAAPTGAECGQNAIDCFAGANCNGAAAGSLSPDDCAPASFGTSCKASAPTLVGGSCAPTGGAPSAMPGWQLHHHLCKAAPGSGMCAMGQCVAQPAGATGLCVTGPADAPCPSGWIDQSITAFGGESDGRVCTACACGAPTGSCSGGTYQLSQVALCDIGSTFGPGACFSGGGTLFADWKGAAPGAAACSPTSAASTPTGDFTATDPVKICCQNL